MLVVLVEFEETEETIEEYAKINKNRDYNGTILRVTNIITICFSARERLKVILSSVRRKNYNGSGNTGI